LLKSGKKKQDRFNVDWEPHQNDKVIN